MRNFLVKWYNLYIYKTQCESVILLPFCLSPRGQIFLTHKRDGTNIFTSWGVGQTFYVVGHDDVDEEMYVSEANILVSKAIKNSPGA